jgi:hypothetical protein
VRIIEYKRLFNKNCVHKKFINYFSEKSVKTGSPKAIYMGASFFMPPGRVFLAACCACDARLITVSRKRRENKNG